MNIEEIFLQEASELIGSLEHILLDLEKDTTNDKLINDAFRVMHNIKGGAGMCEMKKLEQITHQFENLYDKIRGNKLKVDKQIIDLSLKTIDHLTALLADRECADPDNQSNHQYLLDQIKIIETEKVVAAPVDVVAETPAVSEFGTYVIGFKPSLELLLTGNNPLFIIADLRDIGPSVVNARAHDLPQLNKLNPEYSYLKWNITLVSDSLAAIEDAFLFVEDICDIKIEKICDFNIFELAEFDEDKLKDQKSLFSIKKYLNALISPANEPVAVSNNVIIEEKKTEIPTQTAPKESETTKKTAPTEMVNAPVKKSNKITSIRVSSDKLDELMNLVSELVTSQASLSLFAEENKGDRIDMISENIEKLSRRLRDTAFSMTLVPLQDIFYRFERLVRDLSSKLNKNIEFVTKGGDTDLDKSIIEVLSDPLMHIIRNSIDHGIETEEERKASGKTERAQIVLNAFYSGAHVHIKISDNGKGINTEVVKNKAIEKGIINANAQLTHQQILDLIFMPGFSTAAKVTDLSGRGVGMDVVKRNIADLRGEIVLSSEWQKGTTIEVILPLTLSVVDGLLVKIGDIFFVIPLSAVGKCYEVGHDYIRSQYNNLVKLDGEQVPFCYLREEFDMEGEPPLLEEIIVVEYNQMPMGLIVDEIIGEHQAVLKPLGKAFQDLNFISGGTILGDGTIALVLDTDRLVKDYAAEFNLKYNKTAKEIIK